MLKHMVLAIVLCMPRVAVGAGDVIISDGQAGTRYACATSDDKDCDGISNWNEINYTHTDPFQSDSDGDGLSDGVETWNFPQHICSSWLSYQCSSSQKTYQTSGIAADSDHDGISDGQEILVMLTSPYKQDTDGDGLSDINDANPVFFSSQTNQQILDAEEAERNRVADLAEAERNRVACLSVAEREAERQVAEHIAERDRLADVRLAEIEIERRAKTEQWAERQREYKAELEGQAEARKKHESFYMTISAGYSQYAEHRFVQPRLNLGFKLHRPIYIVLGLQEYNNVVALDSYSDPQGRDHKVSYIFPFSIGLIYKLPIGNFRPYFGIYGSFAAYTTIDKDLQLMYYVKTLRGSVGAAAQAGIDISVSKAVAVNIDSSFGFWNGQKWLDADRTNNNFYQIAPYIGVGLTFNSIK